MVNLIDYEYGVQYWGTLTTVTNQTYTNAYTGETITINGDYHVNDFILNASIYSAPVLTENNQTSGLWTLTNDAGEQMFYGWESFSMLGGTDILLLDSTSIELGDLNLYAGEGDGIIWSNSGNDIIYAQSGDDIIHGGPGDDTIYGQAGNDTLRGGTGNDILEGGDGDDTYFYDKGDGNDVITESSGLDTLQIGSGLSFFYLWEYQSGDDHIINFVGSGSITVTDFYSSDNGAVLEQIVFSDGTVYDLTRHLSLNEPPSALADKYTTNEDEPLEGNVLDNDYDVDGDVITVTETGTFSTREGGEIIIQADGSFVYTPPENYSGIDKYIYNITDGGLVESSAQITFTINAAPVAADDIFHLNEDEVVNHNLADAANNPDDQYDYDPDGDFIFFESGVFETAQGGTIDIADEGQFLYTPPENFSGTDSYVYTIYDSEGAADTATVTFVVRSLNDAPVAQGESFVTDEDAAVSGNLLENDSDADGTISIVADSYATEQGGSIEVAEDGTFTYTPAENFHGTDSFTYTVTDNDGATATATATFTVNSVNDGPVAEDDVFNGSEDAQIAGNVLGNDTDIDGDALSVTAGVYETAQGGSVTIAEDGSFTYTPLANFNGQDSFSYEVSDGTDVDTALVTLNVEAVNDGPVAEDDVFNGSEDAQIAGNVLGNDTDIDGDALSVTAGVYETAQGGSVTIAEDGSFTYTPLANFNGQDSFSYEVSDGTDVDTALVTLNVEAVNDGPVAEDDVFSTDTGSITGNVLADNGNGADSDIDGDPLAVVAGVYATDHGSVTIEGDGSFTYNADDGYTGEDSFTYTVTDGVDSDTATVSLTIESSLNQIIGGEGNDTLRGSQGDDIIDGGEGSDRLLGRNGDDYLYAGEGDDRLNGGNGNDSLYGEEGNDRLYGDRGDDSLFGGEGDDYLSAGSGDDILYGEYGRDGLYGGSGSDALYGGEDNDVLVGGSGNDMLYGGAGDDYLFDTSGQDTFVIGEGSDFIFSAGRGDTFVYDVMDDEIDTIYGFSAGSRGDTLDISQILSGYDEQTDDLSDFVRIEGEGWWGWSSSVSVDVDGGGDSFVQIASLASSFLGNNTDAEDLVESGNLIV
ncbi:MAG: Ig-like domain-containing protein [Alphaproteobacteria bacterium]